MSLTDPFPRNGEGEQRPLGKEDKASEQIIQPSTRHLGGAEAVGAQEDFLQVLVRVAEGGGVTGQRADGGDQRKREFHQRTIELRERLRDFGGGEHRVDAVEP